MFNSCCDSIDTNSQSKLRLFLAGFFLGHLSVSNMHRRVCVNWPANKEYNLTNQDNSLR